MKLSYRRCEHCNERFYKYLNRRFCSVECANSYRVALNEERKQNNGQNIGSIVEPRSEKELKEMDTLIAERIKEVRNQIQSHVLARTPIDDSPRSEVRLRRFLRLKRRNGCFGA